MIVDTGCLGKDLGRKEIASCCGMLESHIGVSKSDEDVDTAVYVIQEFCSVY
jgi:hypothetical protein